MITKRLDRWLSSLGYCSRSEVKQFLKMNEVCICKIRVFIPQTKTFHEDVTVNGDALDPVSLTIVLNKPKGFICSHDEAGKLIYELLPIRFQKRNPKLSTIGRLDKDTSGIILLSDNGILNHQLTSPKKTITKIYKVELAENLNGNEKEILENGGLLLKNESKPLLPAKLTILDSKNVLIEIVEGRYHQIKRTFGAFENKVISLHRIKFGTFMLNSLPEGEYKILV